MSTLTLRRACIHDAELLYAWRNHPETYQRFFSNRPVDWDEHLAWLRGLEFDQTRTVLIVEDEGRPVATVAFTTRGKHIIMPKAAVSVTVAPYERGRGYGAQALRLATALALTSLGYCAVYAHIMPDNAASLRAFAAAGYMEHYQNEHEIVMVAMDT